MTAHVHTETWNTGLYIGGYPYPTRYAGDADISLPNDAIQHIRANHEAAHAVTALTYGAHLHQAQIETPDSTAKHAGVTHTCGLDSGQAFAAFCGAGERANNRWLHEQGLWTTSRAVAVETAAFSDRQTFLHLNPHIGFGTTEADYKAVHDLADQIIDAHWTQIMTVTDALLRDLRIEGDAIASLARIPNGPHRAT